MSNVVGTVIDFFDKNHIFYDHNFDEFEHTVDNFHFYEIFMGDTAKKVHGRFMYIFYFFVEEPPESQIKEKKNDNTEKSNTKWIRHQ